MNTSYQIDADHGKDEWLTPPEIVECLGEFDLDPCSPINRPWATAKEHYTVRDNGLLQPWHGRVWCNPPYGGETFKFLHKLKKHGNGIALTFARTETKWFQELVWSGASAILFFDRRLKFYHVDGSQCESNAGAPSVLIAYGKNNIPYLHNVLTAGYAGTIVIGWHQLKHEESNHEIALL